MKKQKDNFIFRLPEYRRARLKKLLAKGKFLRVIEVHDGISGLIAEKSTAIEGNHILQFDAMWISSLCDSIVRGKPDIEIVDISTRLHTIDEILDITTKPIILDGDTGGKIEHFIYNVKTLERIGIYAIIIEDKIGLKKNSLYGTAVNQTQDTIKNFCKKISMGKNSLSDNDFMIIARIESLILEKGIDDAIKRARYYVESGADGIMIHSKKETADEIFNFCDRFREFDFKTPLVVVPTSYHKVTEKELERHGINMVIYANHLARASIPAMQKVAINILKNGSATHIDKDLMPIKNILDLMDTL